MNGRDLVQTPVRERAVGVAAARRDDAWAVGFPVRVVGHSTAPIFPQQVGAWWMEPLTERTPLPPRAAARLRTVLASGITPRAVVVFHELPTAGTTPPPPASPDRATRLGQQAAVLVPRAGALLRAAADGVVQRARPRPRTTPAVDTPPVVDTPRRARVIDPCLVVVTADGTWVEIDRWYS